MIICSLALVAKLALETGRGDLIAASLTESPLVGGLRHGHLRCLSELALSLPVGLSTLVA